ncbi:MAG: hypothetical protein OEV00_02175 [Acidobacteriota bacterium]|nr:hypothetical protein [Acidobacteriota bacterium]MDH3784115.1 hypothetical protein [Acidobacteriota bacterium]
MQRVTRWWAVAMVAVAGAGICLTVITAFFLRIIRNELPWNNGDGARQLYQLVGESYGKGFTAGFFLCFSLTIVAIAISAWVEQIRSARPSNSSRGMDLA